MKQLTHTILESLRQALPRLVVLTAIIMFAFTVNYLYAAWTAPTAAPTGGNIAAPINTSGNPQNKSGFLGLADLYVLNTIEAGPADNDDVKVLTGEFNGSVGAAEYCDEDGNGCVLAADLGNGGAGGGDDELVILSSPVTLIQSQIDGSALSSVIDLTPYAANMRDVLVHTTSVRCDSTNEFKMNAGQAKTFGFPDKLWSSSEWHVVNNNKLDVRIVSAGASGCMMMGTARVELIGYRCHGSCN